MEAILPLRIPMSPEYQGEPVPSMIWPLVITRSKEPVVWAWKKMGKRMAASRIVNRIRFKNPFIPMLRFTMGTGFEIVSKHQSRHLLQAERVRESVNFPA